MKIKVELCESITKIVEVEAINHFRAIEKVQKMYEDGDILFGDKTHNEHGQLEARIYGVDPLKYPSVTQFESLLGW